MSFLWLFLVVLLSATNRTQSSTTYETYNYPIFSLLGPYVHNKATSYCVKFDRERNVTYLEDLQEMCRNAE